MCLLVSPQNCSKTLPLVLAPYPNIFLSVGTKRLDQLRKIFTVPEYSFLEIAVGFWGIEPPYRPPVFSIQLMMGELDTYFCILFNRPSRQSCPVDGIHLHIPPPAARIFRACSLPP